MYKRQVYPSVHKFFGLADILGQRNILDLYAGFSLRWLTEPSDKGFSTIELTVTAHDFRQDERHDINIDIAARPLFPSGTPTGARDIGRELDVELRFFSLITLGYAHFAPGQALNQRGLGTSSEYFYVNIGF